MKYPACHGAHQRPICRRPECDAGNTRAAARAEQFRRPRPAPAHAEGESDETARASGSRAQTVDRPMASASTTPKARAMTERQASRSTGADSRRPMAGDSPHAEGERSLSAKGKGGSRPMAGRRPRVLGGVSLGQGEEGWCAGRFTRGLPKECREKSLAHQPPSHGVDLNSVHHAMGF